MYNQELLENGMAKVMTVPPNVKYVDTFTQLQEEARTNKVGVWADSNIVESVKTNGKYVGSKESDKYHYPNCRWAEKINTENQIWFDSINEADSVGYKPCGVCNPK
jgi:micrococcal nuclease